MERSDLDIPEGTVWPSTEKPDDAGDDGDDAAEPRDAAESVDLGEAIELGPGEQPPLSLDPERDQAERNAASGGWFGANEQIENDFEREQLRRREEEDADPDRDEDVPLT
jgi:hypothetical protein